MDGARKLFGGFPGLKIQTWATQGSWSPALVHPNDKDLSLGTPKP
jgi:hypothetical protein